MPGKLRRRRGKYSLPSKKKKGRPSRPATVIQQPAVAQAHGPVSSTDVSVPSASVPTPTARPAAVQYSYIATELRTISILAGIMLVVLVVLALVPLPW